MRIRCPLTFDALAMALLLACAVVIGTYRTADTGAQWPDGPCYANAAAMIHDWLRSGDLLHPYEFAKQNYRQYPAFAVPFHPPGYPGVLALFFSTFGMSYPAARLFVALCSALFVCSFYGVTRKLGLRPASALACSLLLAATPDVVRWSRDTMSEVPSSAFMMAASLAFLAGLESRSPWKLWSAFALAEVAFLSRVTTLGILPAWFLYAALRGRLRLLFSRQAIAALSIYLAVSCAFVGFAGHFSRYEFQADGRGSGPSWESLTYFSTVLPTLLTSGTALAGLIGLCVLYWRKARSPIAAFWLLVASLLHRLQATLADV